MKGGDKVKNKLQKKLAIPLLVLAIVGVGGSAYTLSHAGPTRVSAQSVAPQVATQTAIDKPENAADKPDVAGAQKQDPSYTSSIKTQESSTEVDDATEAKQLASLAKISQAEANAAAEKSAGGTATSVKLENENGNVVYAVTVGGKEVKVDAGNGTILATETADGGAEAANQPETGN